MLATPLFGFGAHSSYAERDELFALTAIADDEGLDVFSLSDRPYAGDRLDAYATLGFVLGRTRRLAGFANVTSLPTRPAPMLARAVATLAALSDDRVVLGLGAGGLPDRAAAMGFERPTPGAAVGALAEAIELVRRLCQDGAAERSVTVHGRHYRVDAVDPAPVAVPPIWTGSVGPRSLAVTGRLADGWIPGHAADWLSPRFRASRPVIDEAATAAGREPRSVRATFLEEVSRLIGERDVVSRQVSSGRGGSSTSQSLRRERILDASDLAALPMGRAVLLSSGTRAALLELVHWSQTTYSDDVAGSEDHFGPHPVSTTPDATTAPAATEAGR